jgi:hypothetical protein
MARKHKAIVPRAKEIQDIVKIGDLVRDNKVIYLDIETTGLEPARDKITTVAVLEGETCHHFTRDKNLRDLVPYLEARAAKVICTFNGTKFDLPFIEHEFGITILHATIDGYLLSSERLYLPGGLKKLRTGFGWPSLEEQNTGVDAIWLWHMWIRENDPMYRDAMREYCADDVFSLRFVLAHLFNLWASGRGVEHVSIPLVPRRAANPLLESVARRRASSEQEMHASLPQGRFLDEGRVERASLILDSDVQGLRATNVAITATVTGSSGDKYAVRVESIESGTRVHCDCTDFGKNAALPDQKRRFCKHVIKVLSLASKAATMALFREDIAVMFT